MHADLFTAALSHTRRGIQQSLTQHMSACDYRDFCLWMLEQETPQSDRWLELMGVPQMVRLFLYLMKGVAREQDWPHLIECVVHVNLYQMYEVVSDNLAIGLARPVATDAHHEARRELLLGFNAAMVERLEGRSASSAALLEPLRPHAAPLSNFEQSLRPDIHRGLAAPYLARNPTLELTALERAIWPCLEANIESCVALERLSAEGPVASLVREGLANRYRGVSALLLEPDMSFERRLRVGVDTILVTPMTAWYIGVLARLYEEKGLESLVRDGLLQEVLDDSSFLLRLLNDVGTPLLRQTAAEREALFEPLRNAAWADPDEPLADLLLRTSTAIPALSRVHKDVQHGEFNVCLHGLMDAPVSQSLEIFETRLGEVARMFVERRERWESRLRRLRERLAHDAIEQLIHRFVVFHEKLYANRYSEQRGEYAV